MFYENARSWLYRGTIARRKLVKVVLSKESWASWIGLSFALSIVYFAEVRNANGFDPKSNNRLWVSSLNASLAFPLDVPLSVLDSTAAALLPVRRRPL
jgi:hypothetical protein